MCALVVQRTTSNGVVGGTSITDTYAFVAMRSVNVERVLLR